VRVAHRLLWLVLVVCAAGGIGCRRNPCLALCETNAKALGCHHADQCKSSCQKLHDATVCATQLKEFEACFLKEPPEHWECDDFDGVPALKDGVCAPERKYVMACVQAQAPMPPPPKKP
jgi:hypothetical protein